MRYLIQKCRKNFIFLANLSKKSGDEVSKKTLSRIPREADPEPEAQQQNQQQHRSYSHYSNNGRTSGGDVRRTFHVHRGVRHQSAGAPHRAPALPPTSPPSPPPTLTVSSTTSNPALYYFKPIDSTSASVSGSSSTSYSSTSGQVSDDNLALPGGYQPTYVVYPTTPSPKVTPSSNSQKYLKPKKSTFRPAGSYDAPKAPSQSIYREETSKFHPASLVHLPKVMICPFSVLR